MVDSRDGHSSGYWFRAKPSGLGWDWPLAWQGWCLYGLVFGVAGVGFLYFDHPEQDGLYGSLIVGSVLILVVAALIKGEPLKRKR